MNFILSFLGLEPDISEESWRKRALTPEEAASDENRRRSLMDGRNSPLNRAENDVFLSNRPRNQGSKQRRNSLGSSSTHLVEAALRTENLLEHGLQRLDRNVWIFNDVLSTSEGRDKVYKVIQNICKIGRWHYRYNNRRDDLRETFETVHTYSKITRIYLKLFNLMSFVRLFVRVARLQENSVLKFLALGRLGGLALYFFCQYPLWLTLNRVHRGLNDRWWKRVALIGYICSALCSFAIDLTRMKELISSIREIQQHHRAWLYWRSVELPSEVDRIAQAGRPELDELEQTQQGPALVLSKPLSLNVAQSELQRLTMITWRTRADIERNLASQPSPTPPDTPDASVQTNPTIECESKLVDTSPSPTPVLNSRASSPAPTTATSASTSRLSLKPTKERYELVLKELVAAEQSLKQGLRGLLINYFKDVLDFTCAINDFFFLGMHDGAQGVLGVAAGLISLARLWQRKKLEYVKQFASK